MDLTTLKLELICAVQRGELKLASKLVADLPQDEEMVRQMKNVIELRLEQIEEEEDDDQGDLVSEDEDLTESSDEGFQEATSSSTSAISTTTDDSDVYF